MHSKRQQAQTQLRQHLLQQLPLQKTLELQRQLAMPRLQMTLQQEE
jgi:hypothetical protein